MVRGVYSEKKNQHGQNLYEYFWNRSQESESIGEVKAIFYPKTTIC